MERFDRFYLDTWDDFEMSGYSGKMLETSKSGISKLSRFDFQGTNSLHIIISKNDPGLSSQGWEKENLIKGMSEITQEKFVNFREEKVAKLYAQWIYLFIRLLGKGLPYQCFENEKMYLIYFPNQNLTLEGTKSKYDFEFKGNENSKSYFFCIDPENYRVTKEIVKGYNLIDLDAISIYYIWQEFIPNMWGFDFD